MNDITVLCKKRDAVLNTITELEDALEVAILNHDTKKYSLLTAYTNAHYRLFKIQEELEAAFHETPKKSFLKKLFKK